MVAENRTSEWTIWVVAASCALHAAEEYLTGWQTWAAETLSIVAPTTPFVTANAVLVIAHGLHRVPKDRFYLSDFHWQNGCPYHDKP